VKVQVPEKSKKKDVENIAGMLNNLLQQKFSNVSGATIEDLQDDDDDNDQDWT
jgi:hypothetical protein